jgi:hypothetical protein
MTPKGLKQTWDNPDQVSLKEMAGSSITSGKEEATREDL